MSAEALPDPSPVLELLSAFRKSKVLFAACELGVFEALRSGPVQVAPLAETLKCNADALERLLGAAVMLGLLIRLEAGYANTPAATAYLTTDSPRRMLGYINYSSAVLWKMWDNLPGAIVEGTHRWKQTYGSDGPIFSQFFRTDWQRREFIQGMHAYGLISSPKVVDAVDLGRFNTFADLGGATGHLTVAACRRWTNLRGIVFDLNEVIPITKEFLPSDVAERIDIIGGDFFADELPKADVYALGRIVHDWSEAKIGLLLGKILAALPTGGAVFIAEKILDDAKTGPEWAVLQHLNMLAVAEGKERTEGEYAELLRGTGFTGVKCVRTDSPRDVVMGVKG